jgi:NAD(P)-dependent dehydrogenase (short-subunit alcohol dehydrogenase family)
VLTIGASPLFLLLFIGVEGMSDALRRELMLFGIDVVIIEPGTVNTAMYGLLSHF